MGENSWSWQGSAGAQVHMHLLLLPPGGPGAQRGRGGQEGDHEAPSPDRRGGGAPGQSEDDKRAAPASQVDLVAGVRSL